MRQLAIYSFLLAGCQTGAVIVDDGAADADTDADTDSDTDTEPAPPDYNGYYQGQVHAVILPSWSDETPCEGDVELSVADNHEVQGFSSCIVEGWGLDLEGDVAGQLDLNGIFEGTYSFSFGGGQTIEMVVTGVFDEDSGAALSFGYEGEYFDVEDGTITAQRE